MKNTPVLSIRDLHQYFEQGTINETHALQGINLTITEGEFVTIIGGNGAGKSTLLNSIAGTLPIDTGQIVLDGKDITYDSVTKRARWIARVFQDPKMGTAQRLSVAENVALAAKRGEHHSLFRFGTPRSARPRFQAALKRLNLGLEDRLDTEIGLLSGGQRQAITLLMATLQKPEMLLLDEHTAALDPKTSATVLHLTEQLVNEEDLTALMITHNMQDAIKYGNRLLMLDHGKIVVDIAGEEKKHLTVPQLLDLFNKASQEELTDDELLLSADK
jgi:putative ABC transport system ATP-binding protein